MYEETSGLSDAEAHTVQVTADPPSVSLGDDSVVLEGSSVALAAALSDDAGFGGHVSFIKLTAGKKIHNRQLHALADRGGGA